MPIILVIVCAEPNCMTHNDLQNNMICSPGSSDYILERGLVSDNNRTIGISLKACRIIDINKESFHSLSSLEDLDLSLNSISNLRLEIFDGTPKLMSLNLSYNLLTAIPLGFFNQTPNIELLDLRGNKINILEEGFLDPLKKLKHLDLASNLLIGKQLSPYIFNINRHIKFIDFSRNEMSDTSELLTHAFQEMNILNLDRCFLTGLPNFALRHNMRTMKQLIMSTNQINNLDNSTAFVNLDNLEILNLAYNKINSIVGNIFVPLKKVKIIVLRNNKLKSIPDNLFRDLPELANLDLSHNLIDFIPVNAFRGAPLKNLNLSDNKFTYLTDNFCLELRNSGGKLKKIFFNDNPWQCACLFDFLAEVKRMGISYNAVKYNGKTQVCVTEQFSCQRQQNVNAMYVKLYNNLINHKQQ